MGISVYIGVKLFDITVVGRSAHFQGDAALGFGYFMMLAGAVLTGLHFVFVGLFPNWMEGRKNRKTANQSTDPVP
jgi:hypothetical protein